MADPTRRSTRFSMRSKQLGQLLLENGDVSAEQVAQALKQQEESGGLIGQVLQQAGACDENAIAAALLKQVQVTDVKCEELVVAPEVAQLVDRGTCEAERLCPFERLGNLLCLVMGNPLNRKAITQIEEQTRLKVKSFKSVWPKISDLINRTYTEENIPTGDQSEAVGGDELTLSPSGGEMEVASPEAAQEPEPLQLDSEPAAEAGIVEIPPAIIPSGKKTNVSGRTSSMNLAAATAAAKKRSPEPPPEPKIKGIDSLDESNAEVIQVNQRGLRQRSSSVVDDEPVAPKPQKVAKVNIDLDALDISSGEVVAGAGDDTEEGLEEISAAPQKPTTKPKPSVISLKIIDDSYFYADGNAPTGPRSNELLDLIENIPVAAVVAQSIGEYEAKQKEAATPKPVEKPVLKPQPSAAALASRPIELQPVPAAAMIPVLISESEFQKQIANLGEDPVGEWDWKYAAAGPVPALEYEE